MKIFLRNFIVVFFFTSILFPQTISWQQLTDPTGERRYLLPQLLTVIFLPAADYNQKRSFRSTDGGLFWQRKEQWHLFNG